jgi:hypothetical protein
MFTMIIPVRNNKARITTPTTLIAFMAKLGHFAHAKLDNGWYLVPFSITHSVHRIPPYPVAQLVGASYRSTYPPLQESCLGHSIIVVEFKVFRQYPISASITEPPVQIALSIQLMHSVEFHLRVYVPYEHFEHSPLENSCSPG